METYLVGRPDTILRGRVRLPASKSLSNRALIIRWLSGSKTGIHNLSTAEDTVLMDHLLKKITQYKGSRQETVLDCDNAGTVLRFLTALLAVTPGRWLLTGSQRMQKRPIAPLVESLQKLGGNIGYAGTPGFPPLQIEGGPLRGGDLSIDAGISSQFISALMLIAPVLPGGLRLDLRGAVSSRPYIDMTAAMMRHWGAGVISQNQLIRVDPGAYEPFEYHVEPDWSAAAFWYEIMALAGSGEVFLEGLQEASLQGDASLPGLFERLGVGTSLERDGIRLTAKKRECPSLNLDFTANPDLAQALIATSAGLGMEGRFTGLGTLRIKETDRLAALKEELGKTGSVIELSGDAELHLKPRTTQTITSPSPLLFLSCGDHRMAMALAPLCLVYGTVRISMPGVVEKSYPGFWDDLENAGFKIKRADR